MTQKIENTLNIAMNTKIKRTHKIIKKYDNVEDFINSEEATDIWSGFQCDSNKRVARMFDDEGKWICAYVVEGEEYGSPIMYTVIKIKNNVYSLSRVSISSCLSAYDVQAISIENDEINFHDLWIGKDNLRNLKLDNIVTIVN